MKPSAYIVSLLLALLLCGCETGNDRESGGLPIDAQLPDQVLTNTEIYLTKAGRRTGVIKADTLKIYSNKDTTLLYTVEVEFYDSSGTQVSTLVSDSARVMNQASVFEASGNVVAWTEDGKKLETDSLRWDAASDLVTTRGFVRTYRGDDTLSGWGLETDERLENIIIKNVQGSFSEPATDRN